LAASRIQKSGCNGGEELSQIFFGEGNAFHEVKEKRKKVPGRRDRLRTSTARLEAPVRAQKASAYHRIIALTSIRIKKEERGDGVRFRSRGHMSAHRFSLIAGHAKGEGGVKGLTEPPTLTLSGDEKANEKGKKKRSLRSH